MLGREQIGSQWWRLCNLYTIRNKQGRLIPFVPNLEQERYYFARHTCNHIGKARQLGFSTFHKILALDAMLFPSGDSVLPPSPDGISVGHIDFTMEDAKKKLRIVRDAYEHLDDPKLHPNTWQIGSVIKRTIRMKASAEQIHFSNGSALWIGTSLRGSTPQILDISELGKIAYYYAPKAEEIRSGALNTIAPGNIVNIESTHEGGEAGLHYDLLYACMEADPESLTVVDFKFHFFPWYDCPDYHLEAPNAKIRPEILAYFERLSIQLDRQFTHGQMLWYDRTQAKQRYAMKKEYPTTPGEMFEAINQYAIYGTEMADLTAAHPPRVCDFGPDRSLPLFTAWDIGMSDYTAIWLIQPCGRFFLALDWFEASGYSTHVYAEKMREWEAKYGKVIARHLLPHDADAIRPGEGKSYVTYLREAGLSNIVVVPRVPDVWLGIGYVRDILPHFYFQETNTNTPREIEGQKLPSGLACLKGYHRETSPANKTLREMPAHDQFSHSCDAFRTFAEAWKRGMVEASDSQQNQPVKVGGPTRRRRR